MKAASPKHGPELLMLLAAGALMVFCGPSWAGASCAAPNLTGDVDVDTQLSGDVYALNLVRIDAELTLAPGTTVTACSSDTQFSVRDTGTLIAEGTEASPIRFQADPGLTENWRRIILGADSGNSRLRYVVVEDAGRSNNVNDGAVYVDNTANFQQDAAPVLDHLTISNSASNGLVLLRGGSDPSPAAVSNLTVTGAAQAPVYAGPSALSGLAGENRLTGNAIDRIVVVGGDIRIPTVWRDHGVPYEVAGSIRLSTGVDPGPFDWIIDPGVTLLLRPGVQVDVVDDSSALMAIGTADQPITMTRLNDSSDFWNQLIFNSDRDSRLEYVDVSFGGQTGGLATSDRMILNIGDGQLTIDHSRIANSQSNGIQASDGSVVVSNSVVSGNGGYGVLTSRSSRVRLRNNEIVNNSAGGVENGSPGNSCVDAIGNFWGDPSGPSAPGAGTDGCGAVTPTSGMGDGVSGGVLFRPWRSAGGTQVTDRALIEVTPRFVVANGVFEGQITATVLDADQTPLAGKLVEFETTLGDLLQPLAPTDENGQVTALITSDTSGFATLSATNVTDGEPLAAIGGVTFWPGPGDTGGLIDPNGSPYASPRLEIERPPFIVGTPMEFRVPMQNTRAVPLDVEVTYGVNRLQVGVPFTTVDTVSRTLAPGEFWDAAGFYVPTGAGHRCVVASVSFSEAAGGRKGTGGFSKRRNTDSNPCGDLDAGNLIPTRGGLLGVVRHIFNAVGEAEKASRCIQEQVNFRKGVTIAPDYTLTFEPPQLTPPTYSAGGDIPTASLADSMTNVSAIAGEISALTTALSVTRQRLQWAAQAQAAGFVDVQYFNFRRYSSRLGERLLALADALDQHLLELAGAAIPDLLFTPQDQADFLALLETSGFEQHTVDYLLDSGWTAEELGLRLQETIAAYRRQVPAPVTFYGTVRQFRDQVRERGEDLVARYGGSGSKGLLAQPPLDPAVYEFRVGHDRGQTETVSLSVKSDSLPLDWTYELADRELTLAAGEVTTSTLTLYPGIDNVPGQVVALSVEGTIDGELTGGITFEYRVPQLLENVSTVFADGFEN